MGLRRNPILLQAMVAALVLSASPAPPPEPEEDEPEDDGTELCEGCGHAFEKDELDDGQCDECKEEERLEAEHHRLESHPSRFL